MSRIEWMQVAMSNWRSLLSRMRRAGVGFGIEAPLEKVGENCGHDRWRRIWSQSQIHGFITNCEFVNLSRRFNNSSATSGSQSMLEAPAALTICSHAICDVRTKAASGVLKATLGIGKFRGDTPKTSHRNFGYAIQWQFDSQAGKGFLRQGPRRILAKDFSIHGKGTADEQPIKNSFEKLKSAFEASQRGFLQTPDAIQHIPQMDPNGVYANYNLRLDQIKVYGFDYDYTLAHYTDALQPLIYDLAMKHLVTEYRYPESCLNFKYDPEFPIRGLYYDKKNGILLKLDFFHSVEPHSCFFGRRRLSRAELDMHYGGKHISVSDIPNLVALMDLFCFSEACLISDVIQHFVDQSMEFDSAYVYDDVKRSIQFVHRSGLMHNTVLSDPAKYLVKNDAAVNMLRKLKENGKKLFILTNSPFPFVNGGMRFLFQEDGKCGDSWRELFDVILASADKPAFYTSERPFRFF